MALRAFYDGSGKARGPNIHFLSLGSLIGTEVSWDAFKAEWLGALEKHDAPKSRRGNRYFHSKEAMHSHDGYERWGRRRVSSLISDLLNTLARPERGDPIVMSCSIKIDDYRKAKERIPFLRPAEAICLDVCFGLAVRHPERESGIELYFDRYPILKKLWKHRETPKRIWWARYISAITEIDDMRDEPEIQAADLLAWLANRYRTHGSGDEWGRLFWGTFLLKTHHHGYVDETGIDALFDSDGKMRPDAQLPEIFHRRTLSHAIGCIK